MKKSRLSVNAVLYCVTAIVCAVILGLFYMKAHRYVPVEDIVPVLDQQKGVIKMWDGEEVVAIDLNEVAEVW